MAERCLNSSIFVKLEVDSSCNRAEFCNDFRLSGSFGEESVNTFSFNRFPSNTMGDEMTASGFP